MKNIIMTKKQSVIIIIIYAIIFIANISSILFSILFSDTPDKLFMEGEFITWLSCVNLIMLAGISLCSLLIISFFEKSVNNRKNMFLFFSFCFLGFLFLGVDEWFLVHENLDIWIHKVFNINETSLTDRLDDLIVLVYGLYGSAVFFFFCRIFWQDKKIKRWLLISVILFSIMVLLDILGNDNYFYKYITDQSYLYFEISIVLGITEDSMKIMAETSLIIGFLEIFQFLLKVLKSDNAQISTNR